jgi:hypothetical protein
MQPKVLADELQKILGQPARGCLKLWADHLFFSDQIAETGPTETVGTIGRRYWWKRIAPTISRFVPWTANKYHAALPTFLRSGMTKKRFWSCWHNFQLHWLVLVRGTCRQTFALFIHSGLLLMRHWAFSLLWLAHFLLTRFFHFIQCFCATDVCSNS